MMAQLSPAEKQDAAAILFKKHSRIECGVFDIQKAAIRQLKNFHHISYPLVFTYSKQPQRFPASGKPPILLRLHLLRVDSLCHHEKSAVVNMISTG